MSDNQQSHDQGPVSVGNKDGLDRSRIQDRHHLKWLTPNELFQGMLDLSPYADGTSFRQELARIREGELFEFQALGMSRQSPQDVALYKEKCKEWEAARQRALSLAEELFRRYGAEAAWIAYGRRSPFHDEELIPPQFWSFLTFDRGSMTAANAHYGLEFAGIRCLILGDIPKPWQGLALSEIKEAVTKARQDMRKQLSPVNNSKPIDSDRGKKLPLYNQVFLAYACLEQKDKERIAYRGGKTEIAKIIAKQIPDAQISSIERELRNVLKDKDLT